MGRKGLVLVASVGAFFAAPALAHFQSIYTPEANLDAPATIPVDVMFWHPLSSGLVMDMAKPQEFFMVHDGVRTDLLDRLKPIKLKSWVNAADAFQAAVPVQSPGDYVFGLAPQPYHEETEDIYIQQFTKLAVNRGQLPTGWDKPIGLKAEIIPYQKPYNVVVGATFSGVVLFDGKPVAGAKMEVEYIAAPPDMATNATGQPAAAGMPGGAITLVTDANGVFTFGLPRAGWWGFAALDLAGADAQFDGKHLSQDAVIWVNASDFGLPSTQVAAATAPGNATGGGTAVALAGGGFTQDLEDAVAKSIREQLRPIRTELALYRAEASYPVTLGGIGFIIGLSGLGFYYYARQRSQHGSGRRV